MQLNYTASQSSAVVENCAICQEPLRQDVASTSACSHRFHKDCIMSWTQITNTCPLCKARYTHIHSGQLKIKVQSKEQRHTEDDDANARALAEEPCQICGSTDLAELALLCDDCDGCFHTHCVGLDDVPEGAWFCDTCVHLQTGNNGNRRGRSRARRRSAYNGSPTLRRFVSTNEHNPEWLATQDEEWR